AGSEDPFEVAIVDLMMPEMDGAAVAAAMRSDAALQDLAVILLTSAGKSERDMPGVDAEMVKPVRPSQLFDVLHTLLAGRSGRAPVEPAPHEAGARGHGARVLVVDDNAANQKVALRMVERLGYRGDVAGTGAEAVAMVGHGHYDAVLMDSGAVGEDVDHLLRGRGAARLVGQLHLFGRQVWSEVEKPVRKNHQRVARLQTCLAGQELAVRKDADRGTALGQQLLARGSP